MISIVNYLFEGKKISDADAWWYKGEHPEAAPQWAKDIINAKSKKERDAAVRREIGALLNR